MGVYDADVVKEGREKEEERNREKRCGETL